MQATLHMQATLQYTGHIAICKPHCNMQAILQHAGHIAICRPHCNMHTTLQYAGHIAICRPHCRPTSGSVWYRRRVVSLSPYCTTGSLRSRCLFMFVSFIINCLFSDLYQTRFGRRYDKTNGGYLGGKHS